MIVLKIILFIILAVFALIFLLLMLPIQAEVSFINNKFFYSFKYAFFSIINSNGEGLLRENKKKKNKKTNESSSYNSDKSPTAFKEETSIPSEENPKPEIKSDSGYAPVENHEDDTEINNKSSDKIQEKSDIKETKTATKNKKSKPTENNDNLDDTDNSDNENKKTLGDKLDFLISIWKCAKHPIKRLLKGFHINSLYIDFIIANEDAYKCAVNYGRIGGLVYNLIAVLSSLFSVKFKTVDVIPDFNRKKNQWDAGCKIWFLPIIAVIMAVWFGVTFLFRVFIPSKFKNKKQSQKAE